jgi:hypothetical protein
MSERDSTRRGDEVTGRRGDRTMEECVQAMLGTAYPRAGTPAKPTEALRQRVAELASRHDMQAARARPRARAWWAALAARRAALPFAACLVAAMGGFVFLRAEHGQPAGEPTSLAAAQPQPGAASAKGSPTRTASVEPAAGAAPTRTSVPARARLTARPTAGGRTDQAKALPVAEPSLPVTVVNPSLTSSARTVARAPGSGDDLTALNGDAEAAVERWAPRPADRWGALEAKVQAVVPVRDEFVQIPFPRLASTSDRQMVAAVESYKREAAVVDPRLSREVTLEQKATALADLCERLRADTGVAVVAGRSVADEKVSLFCRKMPLREVMRQLSRPFGYTWLRSGKGGEYRYELVQDLRSQLLEEDLRQRDRNAAMLALDREMTQFHKFLGLTPEQARAAAAHASLLEKPALQKLATPAWGPIQLYFRLSRADLAALRSGQRLTFSTEPKTGEQPLPPDVAHGVLQSQGRAREEDEQVLRRPEDGAAPPSGGAPAAEPKPEVVLAIQQSELGRFTLTGTTTIALASSEGMMRRISREEIASGESPAVMKPDNGLANAKLARDPALRPRVTVRPQPSCRPDPAPRAASSRGGAPPQAKVTTADVLQALHRASGLPIVTDYYTRLYAPAAVSVADTPVFDALNRLADTMRMRWNKEGAWLQLRSTSYYDDRLKEVSNRLLAHWAAARKQHGELTLDDLVEIAQLSDAQLDASSMAEGARSCFGLAEWDLGRNRELRPHLRYLSTFTPAQRQEIQSAKGLPFTRMSLAQQQQFIALAFGGQADRLQSLEELTGAALRIDYSVPGMFEWRAPESPGSRQAERPRPGGPSTRTNIALRPRGAPAPTGPVQISPARERTREAALEAARRIDPQADASQIVPTELAVTVIYTLSGPNGGGSPLALRVTGGGTQAMSMRLPRRRQP